MMAVLLTKSTIDAIALLFKRTVEMNNEHRKNHVTYLSCVLQYLTHL